MIYDIKCPDSKMAARNRWENLPHLKPQDEVKFVLGSRQDYEWAKDKIRELDLDSRHTVLFSPVWNQVEPRQLAEWVLEDGLQVLLQVQLHKLLWGEKAQGV